MSIWKAGEQVFELCLGTVDSFSEALGVVARPRQLLAQVMVLGAQLFAQSDELRDLGLEGDELRFHVCKYGANSPLRQEIRGVFECVS